MKVVKSIQLFFQEGTSDKVYNATIVEEDGLYTVQVEWGRRGSTLNRGTKAVRVPLEAAERAYAKVVREKTTKGYEAITAEVAPAAVAPPVGQGSGSKAGRAGRPRLAQQAQLLNAVDDDALERLLVDDRMVAQQKLDGMRVLVHIAEGEPVATNRAGQLVALDQRLVRAVRGLPAGTVLDGEVVPGEGGPSYWLFDLLQLGTEDLRGAGYLERYDWLEDMMIAEPLRLVPTARGTRAKRALLARLQADRAEGIVFKRGDARYKPGRPAAGGDQLKYKFIKTADVVITENAGNAYQMAVYDGGRLRPAGRVFAGTTNDSRRELDELLAAGETPVAEVRYLYATEDDILYQPVFVKLRDDKEPDDCSHAQLVRSSHRALAEEPAAPTTTTPAGKAGGRSRSKVKPSA